MSLRLSSVLKTEKRRRKEGLRGGEVGREDKGDTETGVAAMETLQICNPYK